ncbi:MAG: IPTL-CTERM sorting domain-containing protein [Candidatus Latescibacteria bacterium]|nr:IPTL-CTERM sorting domain-containing protein [Candidatus Latescibacterota bacterium]NIM21776.1 IPTL-CTERM sorting domain-containing protein [Candidatus Latescibacterota bacterium]NIM65914.1 IPTL-CTERM sorting domain-containing protein [Candidatus Latescibacterota bacterium]NIO02659.1 IPTL-CTERM sorting domain-containing protein [Candidatus Latescibacterota bacterium]NIO29640.1 IPTL-CTERM sorting domain-containing protein [Candidatus Latescibacterota bacterium]
MRSLKPTAVFLFLLFLSSVMIPTAAQAIKYEVVVFDPNFQPPPGVFSSGRSQATRMILDHIRSNFSWADTTVQVGTSAPPSTGANDAVNTVKILDSYSTSYFSHRGDADWQTEAWGVTYGDDEHYAFGRDFNSSAPFQSANASNEYARGMGGTIAHELGHGLNATHTGNMSDKMCSAATAGEKAITDRSFTLANQARMRSAANAGGAAPAGGRGRERVTVVYSHLPPGVDPTIKQEDKWYVNVTIEMLDPAYDFGYINSAGNFIRLEDIDSFFDVQLFGGVTYEFALRDKLDITAVYPLSHYGEAIPGGMVFPPTEAVAPILDDLYFGEMDLWFEIPTGPMESAPTVPVNVHLSTEGNNGFVKLPYTQIPMLQHWGMVLLALILIGFAIYRIRARTAKSAA